jgi:hypothetical protein
MRGVNLDALPLQETWPGFLSELPINPRDYFLSMSGAESATGAIPIIAARVALPDSTKGVDLLSLLPPSVAANYATPDKLLLQVPKPPAKRRPPPSFFGEAKEYPLLVKRLLAADMVSLSANRPKVVNGLFGTPKSHPRFDIRLIFHGQPVNEAMVDPPATDLPSVDLFASLIADPTKPLFACKTDLSNFYHKLKLPEPLWTYFGLPPVYVDAIGLPPEELAKYPVGAIIYPVYTRLPMGWSHSVFLAQTAHVYQIATKTSRPLADRILWSSDRLIDRMRYGIYIDDDCDLGTEGGELEEKQQEYISVFDPLVGVNHDKSAPPSQEQTLLGLHLSADKSLGVHPTKLWALIKETEGLIQTGTATGLQLHRIVGKWSHAILVRRPVFSVLDSTFSFIQRAGNRKFNLWQSVVRELRVLCDLAPLLVCSLASDICSTVVATDASLTGLGVVALQAEWDQVVDAMAAPSRLPAPGEAPVVSPSLAPILQAPATTIVASRWRDPEHITVLELRAVQTALRWLTTRPACRDSKVLLLVDSSPALFGIAKGRSSSRKLKLNYRLRSIAALALAAGITLSCKWVPSSSNPADAPSRIYDPPPL